MRRSFPIHPPKGKTIWSDPSGAKLFQEADANLCASGGLAQLSDGSGQTLAEDLADLCARSPCLLLEGVGELLCKRGVGFDLLEGGADLLAVALFDLLSADLLDFGGILGTDTIWHGWFPLSGMEGRKRALCEQALACFARCTSRQTIDHAS